MMMMMVNDVGSLNGGNSVITGFPKHVLGGGGDCVYINIDLLGGNSHHSMPESLLCTVSFLLLLRYFTITFP